MQPLQSGATILWLTGLSENLEHFRTTLARFCHGDKLWLKCKSVPALVTDELAGCDLVRAYVRRPVIRLYDGGRYAFKPGNSMNVC